MGEWDEFCETYLGQVTYVKEGNDRSRPQGGCLRWRVADLKSSLIIPTCITSGMYHIIVMTDGNQLS